jgi:hypothetical protein
MGGGVPFIRKPSGCKGHFNSINLHEFLKD